MTKAIGEMPYSQQAEQSVLGGLMIANERWDDVVEIITEKSFYARAHRRIFRAISRLLETGKAADPVSVADFLGGFGELDEVGGLPYVVDLYRNTPTAANILHYANLVRETALRRAIMSASAEILERCQSPNGLESSAILDMAQSKMMALSETAAKGKAGPQHVSMVMEQVIAHIEFLRERAGQSDITGLPTGFDDLDKMTTGLQGGDLVILAARPSMGKTALALGVCEHVVLKQEKNAAFFSLEMANNQLGVRLLSGVSRLHQQRVKVGRLNDSEAERMYSSAAKLMGANLYLDEEGALTVNELRARARRIHRECGGLNLILIDYLQLMQGNGSDNRASELAEISRGLKLLAKELNIPIIALSQLNRSLESRPNKRPVMSDLRDSGGIEQDADLILFIYRDEYYNDESMDKGIAELIIGKQRNGPTGTVRLAFLGEQTRFENLVRGTPIPSQVERDRKREKRAGAYRNKDDAAHGYVDM